MISLAVPKQLGSVKNAKHQESCTNIFSSPFSHVWRVIDFNATDDHNFQEGHTLDMRCLFIYFLQKLLKQKFGLKKKSNIMCQVISSPPNIKSYVYNFKILNQLWEIVQISFLPATRKQTVYVSTTPIFQEPDSTITDCSGPGPFDFLRHHLFGTSIPTIVSNPHLKLPIFTAPLPDSNPHREISSEKPAITFY